MGNPFNAPTPQVFRRNHPTRVESSTLLHLFRGRVN